MVDDRVHNTPSEVTAEQGEVQIDGPAGIAFSMTPAAAAETSARMLKCAAEAEGQRADKDKRSSPQ